MDFGVVDLLANEAYVNICVQVIVWKYVFIYPG